MRILDYAIREGLKATLRRVSQRLSAQWGGISACTTFLCMERLAAERGLPPELEIRPMDKKDRDLFDSFNFFPHIKGGDYLEEESRGAVLCCKGEQIVGYACYEVGGLKSIHGTGAFQLDASEAWVGPCYVDRVHRGKGINRVMISRAMTEAATKGAVRFFTAINSSNASSLASFSKMGFFTFAEYNAKKHAIKVSQDFPRAAYAKKVIIKEVHK